ncbi:MAG: hypothetical protein IJH39_10120 [Clostridia bacterium]|nr:hypothetical protein [Clostridia bacterium]
MKTSVNLYANEKGEINRFLSEFYNTDLDIQNNLNWEKVYENPIEIAEIIGVYVDNLDNFHLNMWISLDEDFYIKITNKNANEFIKYLYERYPY